MRCAVIAAAIGLPLAAAALVFFSRPPALVVTDEPFAVLYGEGRILRQGVLSSLALFRPVRPVFIADNASPDILVAAILSASYDPFAVVFPPRFSAAAERLAGERPDIPIALFAGSALDAGAAADGGRLVVIVPDFAADMYRAGLFAGILGAAGGGGENGQAARVLWSGRPPCEAGRAAFEAGLGESASGVQAVFAGADAGKPDSGGFSSIITAGGALDFFESNPGAPVVMFSWMSPSFAPDWVVAAFDDSHWALAAPAARIAAAGGVPKAEIPSKPLIFSGRIADNNLTRALRRAALSERAEQSSLKH